MYLLCYSFAVTLVYIIFFCYHWWGHKKCVVIHLRCNIPGFIIDHKSTLTITWKPPCVVAYISELDTVLASQGRVFRRRRSVCAPFLPPSPGPLFLSEQSLQSGLVPSLWFRKWQPDGCAGTPGSSRGGRGWGSRVLPTRPDTAWLRKCGVVIKMPVTPLKRIWPFTSTTFLMWWYRCVPLHGPVYEAVTQLVRSAWN